MTDTSDELAGIELAARDLIPDLRERLERHGLGEIEVRRGGLRLRLARGSEATTRTPSSTAAAVEAASPAGGTTQDRAASASQPATPASPTQAVRAPAVGYFIYGDGLGPGIPVQKGDSLGHVDVLGVRHDVRAPRSGVVRNLVTETGEAVEYGQVLIELGAPAS
jgi:acetyl-CoA carboxylase biotin carboxyl carrier protein